MDFAEFVRGKLIADRMKRRRCFVRSLVLVPCMFWAIRHFKGLIGWMGALRWSVGVGFRSCLESRIICAYVVQERVFSVAENLVNSRKIKSD